MRLVWEERAWADYLHWQKTDTRIVTRINMLLRDVTRGIDAANAHTGIGRPEALKHGMSGYWSRRITAEHRLIYKVVGDEVRVATCRHHYVI